jgi:N6-L-threonylcarbamoyladenine synthase
LIVLGIESSCDETACGIVDHEFKVLSNQLYSQIKEHIPFGGVVPELAARSHLQKIGSITQLALEQAGLNLKQIDQIAYTCGPGLMGPLLVGASFARGMARDLNIPAIAINHLEGHIASVHLSNTRLTPPYLCLTVSGGHTELTLVSSYFQYQTLGRTRDDAAGEAFDKCGKILGLSYPAGAEISRLAASGNRSFIVFPRGLRQTQNPEFSFSGLKTSVMRYIENQTPKFIADNLIHIAASIESAIVDSLVDKTIKTMKKYDQNQLVVCGGVSANPWLRQNLQLSCKKNNWEFFAPSPEFCTDNGAMIAAASLFPNKINTLLNKSSVRPWYPLSDIA